VSTETTANPADQAEHSTGHGDAHPNRDGTYIKVALVLALMTGIETFTYFESVYPKSWERLVMPVLLVIMGIKFYLIAAYFMHLRWDRPILRRAFMTGIGIALVVYVITLTAFKFWNGTGFMPH